MMSHLRNTMERVRTVLFWLLYAAAGVCSVILISQGGSFAQWNEFDTVKDKINEHAGLFEVAGVGIFCASALGLYVLAKVAQLQKQVAHLTRPADAQAIAPGAGDLRYISKMKVIAITSASVAVVGFLTSSFLVLRMISTFGSRLDASHSSEQVRVLVASSRSDIAVATLPICCSLVFAVIWMFAVSFMRDRKEHPKGI